MNIETIKTELKEYLNDFISENNDKWMFLENGKWNRDTSDLHNEAFNQEYYIIGAYQCDQWLTKHEVNIFEGIRFVNKYERDTFGDVGEGGYITDNVEKLVNMITYIIGDEVVNELTS
tara:strand:+ start:275 stop:628 length:354 start_codon:yes stop_codon:yes gene_type:complete